MGAQPIIGRQERIDDIPLLIGMMGRMNLAEVPDKHLGRHHLHQGLSNGQRAVGWIAYLLSQSDHRNYAVPDWAEGLSQTLEYLFGCPLRPHELSLASSRVRHPRTAGREATGTRIDPSPPWRGHRILALMRSPTASVRTSQGAGCFIILI
jgi:hypothetical protein